MLTQGNIVHHRSPHNMYFNYHFLYGGFKKYFVDRYLMGYLYKSVKVMWPLALVGYATGCYYMRKYDNACHDYFYFSD